MRISSNAAVDPYALALSKVLDENPDQEPTKFVLNRTKCDLKSDQSIRASAHQSEEKNIILKAAEKVPSTEDGRKNSIPSDVAMEDRVSCKQRNSKLEKYKDTALECLPSKTLNKLSVSESVEMGKVQAEKEKKINIVRKVELFSKFYDKLDEQDMEDEQFADDYESDSSGVVTVVQYE